MIFLDLPVKIFNNYNNNLKRIPYIIKYTFFTGIK